MQARESKPGILPPKKKKEDQRRREAPATGLPRPEQARAGSGELPLFPAFKVISIPCVGCWSGATAEDAGGERPVPSGAVRREAGGQGGRDRRDGAGVSPGPAPRGCGRCPRCPSGPTCPATPRPAGRGPGEPQGLGPRIAPVPGTLGYTGRRSQSPALRGAPGPPSLPAPVGLGPAGRARPPPSTQPRWGSPRGQSRPPRLPTARAGGSRAAQPRDPPGRPVPSVR